MRLKSVRIKAGDIVTLDYARESPKGEATTIHSARKSDVDTLFNECLLLL